MTMTTPASGDYLLTFSTSGEGPSAAQLAFRATVGGSVIAHSVRQEEQESSSANDHIPLGLAVSISPNGSQDVVIQWSRISGTGTIIVSERTMNLIPTAAADIFQATGTADDADSTTTDKQVDDMLITDPGAADYLAIYTSSDFYGAVTSGEGATTYSIQEGGARVTDSERINEHEESLDSVNMQCFAGGRITVAVGTDDVQMFWQGVSTTPRTARERTLVLLREKSSPMEQEGFRFFDDDANEASSTALATQDTNITRAKNLNTRLRGLGDSTGDRPSEGVTIQYRKVGDADSEWRNVPL